MRTDTRIQLVAGALLAGCLVASAMLTPAVSAVAGRAELGYADRAEESDPPEVAVGIALGAFRGLFVNILWVRAQDLKREGKFYESIELSRTITRLQPRFPRVWGFHAWNMAYNISVATKTPQERWQWVKAGIDLLATEGIPKNPNDMLLHKELGWIFIHKIQGQSDDSNHYYKEQFSREWTFLLGPPAPRAGTVEESTRRAGAHLRRIAAAPDTEAKLLRRFPRAEEVVQRLRQEVGLELDMSLLERHEMENALRITRAREGIQIELAEDRRSLGFDRLIEDFQTDQELLRTYIMVLDFVRKRQITKERGMDLGLMIAYTEDRYKRPLDWRHPATHGLYWATRGVDRGMGRINTDDFDVTNTDRLITHGIQEIFRWGTIYHDLINGTYIQTMDLDMADVYEEQFRILVERAQERGDEFEANTRPFKLFSAGYENFLTDLIRIFYRMGDFERAQSYYSKLRNLEFRNINEGSYTEERLSKPLAEFVQLEFEERITSPDYAAGELYGSLQDAYRRGLLMGDMDVFKQSFEYAQKVHRHYTSEQLRRTVAAGGAGWRMEFIPRRFVDAAAQAMVELFLSPQVGLWQKSRMFRMFSAGASADFGREVYRRLLTAVKPSVPDFDQWFPMPAGYEDYLMRRAAIDAQDATERDKNVKVQQQ